MKSIVYDQLINLIIKKVQDKEISTKSQ